MANGNEGHGGGNEGHGHDIHIIVNGREKTVHDEKLTFEQVVALAFDTPAGDTTIYTVIFHNADQKPDHGTLTPGHTVKIKNGTKFDVSATDRS